jgi:HAD superfamily hydrolase (TIGR01509 family)
VIEAVVFDLDGILLDSEQLWDSARRDLVEQQGGEWRESATTDMLGMSSRQWPAYVHDELGVPMSPADISTAVVERVAEGYRRDLPLLPGAREAVARMGERWPLGLATSANREIIDLFLELAGLGDSFAVALSTEEVGEGHGKPAPDVYLEACRRLGVDPSRATAVEDSSNGLRAARAAGMRVIAVPNPHFPPEADALALADAKIGSLEGLTPELAAGEPV